MKGKYFKEGLLEASEFATEIILDSLLPSPHEMLRGNFEALSTDYLTARSSTRFKFRQMLLEEKLDDREMEMVDPNLVGGIADSVKDRVLSGVISIPDGLSLNAVVVYRLTNLMYWQRRETQSDLSFVRLKIGKARRLLERYYLEQSEILSFKTDGETLLDIPDTEIVIVERSIVELLKDHPDQLHKITHRQFEELILELFDKLGYEPHLTPKTRDGGCDLIAFQKDALGVQTKYVVEAKHYAPTNKVGVGIVRQLSAVRQKHEAHHGIIVTSSFFTADAVEENSRYYGLVLSDQDQLFRWLRAV